MQHGRRLLKTQVIKKGPALLILLVVATAFVGLGVFLDEAVIPSQPDTEEIIERTAQKAIAPKQTATPKQSTAPSEITQQLKRAVEAANQTEADTTEQLAEQLASSKSLIEETNQLLEEKGVSSDGMGNSEKSQQFNQKLDDLKARLVELKSSN